MTHSSFQRGYVSDVIKTRNGTAYVIRYRVRKADGTWAHKAERLYGLDGKKAAIPPLVSTRPTISRPIRTSRPRTSIRCCTIS